MFQFRGIIPPVSTPFDDLGSIRYGDYERNIDKYVEAGIETLVLLGSTAESVYLEHDEKIKLLEIARKRVPSSVTLLAGTGLESTRATIELTNEAAGRGMDGVLVKNPSYYKPAMSSEVYAAHYAAIADASSVPVIIYNIPVFTGIQLESRLVTDLAAHPNIHGLKDSSGNIQFLSEIVWSVDAAGFSVVAGVGAVLLPNMLAGAKGGVIGLADVAPKALLMLYRAFTDGDLKRASRIQQIIAPAANAVTSQYGIPGLKAAMALEGFHPGVPRRPLLPATSVQSEHIGQIFRRMNSELAELS